MVSDVSKLRTALENVIALTKKQLQKELAAVVRLSQGTLRASWKVEKAPNWWSEGERIDAHNVNGTINRFGPLKGVSLSDMQAALVMFYSSRLYYENHLKNRLSEAELQEIANGKNPFPAKKYEGKYENTSTTEQDMDEETKQDDVDEDEEQEEAFVVANEKENGKELLVEEEEQTDAETKEASIQEDDADADVDVKPEEDKGEPEEEDEEVTDAEADTSSTAEEQGDPSEVETPESHADPDSDIPQLLKFVAKLKKRPVKARFDALHDRWSEALETRTRRTVDSKEQKVYLTVLGIEMANAKALLNIEEKKKQNADQLQRALNKINTEVRKQQLSLPPSIRNMKLSEFQKLGGTVEKVREELGKRQTQDAVVQTATITQTARKTRRTARKPPITRQTPAGAPSTALRRSRRNASQASAFRTRALLDGTPKRQARTNELLVYSAELGEFRSFDDSPVEVVQPPEVRRTTRATRAGRPPVAPVPFADALSTQLRTNPEGLQEILLETARKQQDPDGFRALLLATAQKVPARRSKR